MDDIPSAHDLPAAGQWLKAGYQTALALMRANLRALEAAGADPEKIADQIEAIEAAEEDAHYFDF